MLPCKIVGLELMGVLQLNYLSIAEINQLNPLMSSFAKFQSVNGWKMQLDKK